MIHDILNKHWRHCCRKEDHITEVQQFFRGLRNREHCPVELRALLKEIGEKLEN